MCDPLRVYCHRIDSNHLSCERPMNPKLKQTSRFLVVGMMMATASLAAAEDSETTPQKADAANGEWIQLFNGKNLDGWVVKIRGYDAGDNFGDTFRVEDGVLKVGYEKYDKFDARFGHIFYKQPFSHYRLRAEYRFVGKQAKGGPGWAIRNSGLMLHGESPETMAKDQEFPASIEVQLRGGGETGERPTANLCTPGTHVVMDGKLLKRHCTDSRSKTYRGDGWVTVEIEVRGSEVIRHIVEGETVLEYTQPQLDEGDEHARELAKKQGGVILESGTISLQSESHPVEFRKVALMRLEPQ